MGSGSRMKAFRRKMIFLEGVLLYVTVVLTITQKLDAWTERKAWMVGNIYGDDGSEKTMDPYKELNKKVALTFDDGPDPQYTPMLLDGLKERNVRATFFVLGKQAEKYPEIIKRMQEEGHLIGNHTYSHIQLKKNNREQFEEELRKTSEIVEGITDTKVQYVRPPYGSWDRSLEKEVNMFPVLWDVDPLDWCKKDVACMVKDIINKVEENDIILMHDQYETSVEAALQMIDELEKQGYEFVTVEELME